MQKKQKIDTIVALLLIFIGIILLILPVFKISNIKFLNIIVFSLYSIITLIQFILTKKSKDYEGLHTFIASLIALIVSIFVKVDNSPRNLAMIMMLWITLMSLTKLKKIDYYHDRHDRMWKLNLFCLILFIITGILASLNLAYSSTVQIIVIGFFMLIHGILELFEPIVKTLIAHS